MGDARFTPRQLAELLNKLDSVVKCAGAARTRIHAKTKSSRTSLADVLVSLHDVKQHAESMRAQIIQVMADRQRETIAPRTKTGVRKRS